MSASLLALGIKWIAGVVVAVLSSAGFVKVIELLANRKESQAKAKVQNVTAEVQLGEGWRVYAEQVEKHFEKYEEGYKATIAALERKIDDERARHDLIIGRKDTEIAQLKEANFKLEETITKLGETITYLREQNHILRNKLQVYAPYDSHAVEEVKQEVPSHLDEAIDAVDHHAPPGGV